MTDDSPSRNTFNTPNFPAISVYDGSEQKTDSYSTLETNLNVNTLFYHRSLRSWIHAVENNHSIFDDLELQLIVTSYGENVMRKSKNSTITFWWWLKTWVNLPNLFLRWWIRNFIWKICKNENFVFGIVLCLLKIVELSQTPQKWQFLLLFLLFLLGAYLSLRLVVP